MKTIEERLAHEKDIIRQDCEACNEPLPTDMETAARDALIGQLMEEIERMQRRIYALESRVDWDDGWDD
jgi:vacuolar-type H+-ATPase subunit D/Vma8